MPAQRYEGLDIFRGMTICFMIIVNTGGDYEHTFAPLLHAKWNGFTPTDLVFPSFLFAVGNSISFVQLKWVELPASRVVLKILKRTLIIFLLVIRAFVVGSLAVCRNLLFRSTIVRIAAR